MDFDFREESINLEHHLSSIPAIIWSYNSEKKEFEILFSSPGSPDPQELHQILSNLVIANKKIVQEDFSRFKIFINSVKSGYPSTIILRYYKNSSDISWIKITCNQDNNTGQITGSIIDITYEADFFNKQPPSLTQSTDESNNSSSYSYEENIRNIFNRIKEHNSIPGMLNEILKNPINSIPQFINIIHAKIHERKNKLVLTDIRGEEIVFSFKDSFAEQIAIEKLEFFIQPDCYKSTQAIDWAFFIPENIAGYFALPFFHRKKLSELIIFCSNKKDFFSPNDAQLFTIYKKLK